MGRIRLAVLAVACCFCFSVQIRCEDALKVTVCQLQKAPPAYDHKLIEVEGFISHDFEDFGFFDPTCENRFGIWLEYGGTAKSDTVYCCGPIAGHERSKELTVEGISIPLVEDDQFRLLEKQIQPPFRSGYHGSIVHAVLIARFFTGRKTTYPSGETAWTGYGHMGCCSLLAIQQVKSVGTQDRNDLDYGASADQPSIDKAGCGFGFLRSFDPTAGILEAQRLAEGDPNSKAFDDPDQVASGFLRARLRLDPAVPIQLKETRRTAGRLVYQWQRPSKQEFDMVVVSRPYLLSFYALDPKRVAWVVIAAYESSCAKGKQVTRIR